MNQKIPTLVGTAIIIILAFAVGYFVWLTQKNNPIETQTTIQPVDETASWQTYKNEQYGFEFKYPKEWKLNLPELDGFSIYLISPETETKIKEVGEYPGADVMIFYYKSVACMQLGCTNPAKSLLENLQTYKASGITGEVKNVNINGINGYETVQLGTAIYYTLYLEDASGIYQIQFNLRSNKSELSNIENKILSTFKFTNNETANWQTYKNEKYGFEFKYPKDWKLSENSGNNYDLSVVSIASPETQKLIKDNQVSYSEDISIYYYPSVSDEPENVANKLGATTLEELIEKNTFIEKIGTTELGGAQATDVILGGESLYYAILATKNSHLYEVWSSAYKKEDLTSVEKNIISTFKFIN